MPALDEELEDLVEDLGDSSDGVGTDPGPLSEPERTVVDDKLTSALLHIAAVLVEINGSGQADPNNLPGTLPKIAGECVDLADQAHQESRAAMPDLDLIGNCIKTVQRIITITPDGYRDRAGIT